LAHFALLIGKIDGGEHLEPFVHRSLVHVLNAGVAFHVRLAETEEDPEIRVLRKCTRVQEKQSCDNEQYSFHFDYSVFVTKLWFGCDESPDEPAGGKVTEPAVLYKYDLTQAF
jgi:hypothetical protein